MSSATDKRKVNVEASEKRSDALDEVLENNRMAQIRQEIGLIADRSYREQLINDEAYEGYRQLADGREAEELSAEMLEKIRKDAEKHEKRAILINQKIQTAIRAGYASETDEGFLMEHLVVENIDFIEKSGEVEKLIDDKLARMKMDREAYDKLAAHPLIKEAGCLQVDENTAIEFPDLKAFLELSVPERRELLKQLEEALPKAERYAEEHEDEEDEELISQYEKKLDEATEEGIIGKVTHKKFLDEFKANPHKTKVYWNTDSVFKAQMKRYEVMWDQIRTELQGEALANIEAQIDKKGYNDLFAEFGRLKQSETQRLQNGYRAALEKYCAEGTIGQHTIAEFMMWMYRQDLPSKYEAEEQLPEQMERYEKLWEDAEELSGKQQKFLRSKIDVWGYTQLHDQYLKFKNGEDESEEKDPLSRKSLLQLHSTEMKEAIVEAEEMLTEEGEPKKKGFMRVLDKMFTRVNRETFDATSFEAEVHKKAVQANPAVKREAMGRAADDEVDFHAIGLDTEVLEESGRSEVKEEDGYMQVESGGLDGPSRQVQLTVNEEEGLRSFFTEKDRRDFTEKKDDLSLAIWTTGGRTVEMDIQEVSAFRDYLKESEVEKKDHTT